MLQQTLLELLSFHTPSTQESTVHIYIQNFLSRIGMNPQTDTLGNIFVSMPGTGEPILLTAHMDTVSNGIIPIPKIENGIVSSSNSSILGLDDKASVAVILSVIQKMQEKPGRAFECLFTVQEENGCHGANFIVTNNNFPIQSSQGMSFDLPFPLGTILSGSAGLWRAKLSFTGLSGHSARPEKAKNVLLAFNELSSWLLSLNGLSDTRANVGFAQIGKEDCLNIIPDKAEVEIEIRDKKDLEKTLDDFQRILSITQEKFGINISIEKEYIKIPSYFHSPDDMWIKNIEQSFVAQKIQTKYEPFSFGGSDANIFQGKGINVAVLGNGVVDTHSPNERVLLSDLEKVENFLLAFLAS